MIVGSQLLRPYTSSRPMKDVTPMTTVLRAWALVNSVRMVAPAPPPRGVRRDPSGPPEPDRAAGRPPRPRPAVRARRGRRRTPAAGGHQRDQHERRQRAEDEHPTPAEVRDDDDGQRSGRD